MCSGTDIVIIRGTTRIESPVRQMPFLSIPLYILNAYETYQPTTIPQYSCRPALYIHARCFSQSAPKCSHISHSSKDALSR